jgi:dTDP-4-dehydrorhamnose reductase
MRQEQILIIGSNGQLGRALKFKYPNALALGIEDLDITDTSAIEKFSWDKVKCVINASAYTDVDGSETCQGRIKCWQTNAQAVANLSKVIRAKDILLIQISSDYVFNGRLHTHKEDELFSPINVYGQTKAAADLLTANLNKHYIVRTSWLIGDGNNFVNTMLRLGKISEEVSVVNDQYGRLTFTSQVVEAINHLLIYKVPYGTYNVSNSGKVVSWADITTKIFSEAKYSSTVKPISSKEYLKFKKAAYRPANSALDLTKIVKSGLILKDWEEALSKYLEEKS